jgi:hypothetical protein
MTPFALWPCDPVVVLAWVRRTGRERVDYYARPDVKGVKEVYLWAVRSQLGLRARDAWMRADLVVLAGGPEVAHRPVRAMARFLAGMSVSTVIVRRPPNSIIEVDVSTRSSTGDRIADEVMLQGVWALVRPLVQPGLVSLGLADVHALFAGRSVAVGTGTATGRVRCAAAVGAALAQLGRSGSVGPETGILVEVATAQPTSAEIEEVSRQMAMRLPDDIPVVVSDAIDQRLGTAVRITLVASLVRPAVGARRTCPSTAGGSHERPLPRIHEPDRTGAGSSGAAA